MLFLSEGDEGFLRVAGELLRLGCEDQRLAFFTDAQGVRRNLCRVADPPYYAVLRALDGGDSLRAFTLARPGGRVWVALGRRHPLAARLDAEPESLVLIGEHGWLHVPDGPWLDLHAVSVVSLPAATRWQRAAPERRLEVELRLTRAPITRPADLWVLRERALEQVEALVRTVPESVVAQLRFATIQDPRGGDPIVVLRARRSAAGPPALDLDAEAYVPAPQIQDLYLPVGAAVDPPFRPSKLRELLLDGPDADSVVWLAPQGEGGRRGRAFTRESLAEDAFAPLGEWVDYLVSANADALVPWVRSAEFDFDPFVSIGIEWAEGSAPPRPAAPEPGPRKRAAHRGPLRPAAVFEAPIDDAPAEDEAAPEGDAPEDGALTVPADAPRSAIEARLAALEAEFCGLDLPLDDPARVPRWAELGELQAALQRTREAGLCWSRALWETPPPDGPTPAAIARRWAEREAQLQGFPSPAQMLGIVDVIPEDLDEQMIRGLAAAVLALAASGEQLEGEQLAALQRFFASHGERLDLRALWLSRSALARMAGDDRLALFQTRDQIMATLREGVGLARNIPAFVRTYGSDGDAGDLGRLADALGSVRDDYLLATRTRRRSTIESTFPDARTDAYVRLLFAWGLARLGRPQAARDELEAARKLLGPRAADPSEPGSDPVHHAAFLAFEARILQALDGVAPGAPMSAAPDGPIAARERLEQDNLGRYKYDSLVEISRILDPHHGVNAVDRWVESKAGEQPFAGLALLDDPQRLAGLFDDMLAQLPGWDAPRQAKALHNLLEYLDALPEPLATPRLQAALPLIGDLALEQRPPLLRLAIVRAGYLERPELVGAALDTLAASDGALATELPAAYAELLARVAPTTRRTGHEARLHSLLTNLARRVGDERDLATATARLHLAAASAAMGQPGQVQAAFASAHALLPELAVRPGDYQTLLRDMAMTLSRSTPNQAIAGARALFERLAETTDMKTANSHYCLAVIQLMESVVLSLASEDLTLSEWARRWVEEDEHLLHRRIHRDLSYHRSPA
nr:hypothetical protein [Pseudenhygromyxa sp. WMMC2535]